MNPTPVVAMIVGPDVLVIVAVVALLFGGSRIPKLARGLGQASHEFKKGLEQGVDEAPEPSSGPEPQPPDGPHA
jgi:sec-independent protein translocase protein TatA